MSLLRVSTRDIYTNAGFFCTYCTFQYSLCVKSVAELCCYFLYMLKLVVVSKTFKPATIYEEFDNIFTVVKISSPMSEITVDFTFTYRFFLWC